MSPTQQMPPARRRPVPGMTARPLRFPAAQPHSRRRPAGHAAGGRGGACARSGRGPHRSLARGQVRAAPAAPSDGREAGAASQGRRAADYATTRLVNFRIPVDLHDRYRQLVRDAEQQHPRLRHPSLTELVIALLEEGPETADEVAALIRRKRAAEHAEEVSA